MIQRIIRQDLEKGGYEVYEAEDGVDCPDKIPSLFDKFSKTSRTGTAGEKGMGLGLSITKELIERHKGTVDVTSEVGEDTSSRLNFPLLDIDLGNDDIEKEKEATNNSEKS